MNLFQIFLKGIRFLNQSFFSLSLLFFFVLFCFVSFYFAFLNHKIKKWNRRLRILLVILKFYLLLLKKHQHTNTHKKNSLKLCYCNIILLDWKSWKVFSFIVSAVLAVAVALTETKTMCIQNMNCTILIPFFFLLGKLTQKNTHT